MGKGAPPIGETLLMPSRLTFEPLTGRPPGVAISLSNALQKYKEYPNQSIKINRMNLDFQEQQQRFIEKR